MSSRSGFSASPSALLHSVVVPALVGSVLAVSAVGPSSQAAEPIRIGCVAALSGPGASIGTRLKEGAELAIKNASKVGDRPLELIVRDSKGDPTVAQQQVRGLIQENGIVGLLCTTLSSEASALSAGARTGRLSVANIHSSALANEITGKYCNEWTFRTVPSADAISNAVSRFKTNDPTLAQAGWYILASDYLYGRSVAESFKALPNTKILGESYAPLETMDWTPYLNSIVASGAKGLWLPVANGAPYVQLLSQAKNLNLLERITILAPSGLPQDLVDQMGDSGVGIIEPASAVLLSAPATKPVAEDYFKTYARPASEQTLQSYIGANILVQAIQQAKQVTAEGVKTALQTGTFKTIVGDVKFRPGDQQIVAPVWSARIQKLPQPLAGANYTFISTAEYPPATYLPALESTGCVR